MKLLAKLVLISCLYVPVAWSQCSGVNTGGGCVPPPCTPGSPLPCNQQQETPQQTALQQPQAVWADRWGAIASDSKTGGAGTIEGQESKVKAERTALAICASHGATGCEVNFTFHNQCAAAALGDGQLGYAGSPTQEEAEQRAISKCGHSDACKIVYSKCSYAERVR